MDIKELIPAISEELAQMYEDTPYDLKCRLNGYLPEQRVFISARTHYEVATENHDPFALIARKLWLEASDLVIEMGKAKLLPLKPEIAPAFEAGKILSTRPRLIDIIMSWTPNWKTIISNLAGVQYDFGQNRFEIVGYEGTGDGNRPSDRPSIRILSKVIGFIDESNENCNPLLQKFNIGDVTKISTLQLEVVLNRRVD